ncbi:hypothetical protein [Polyangium sp. y55x31]|uniref:hypothetical protein n=1 Tax=Polyangium sp. y55x31 TaxID=3042688 RepID=UPI0024829FC4|nr:hypothetical protein [Polyangium sp. y55x31]MDI1484660.1 hypothetical protein [Polyangium sp. y55x31]
MTYREQDAGRAEEEAQAAAGTLKRGAKLSKKKPGAQWVEIASSTSEALRLGCGLQA